MRMPRVHFSTLKQIAISPLHYVHACNQETADTYSLRLGRLVHALILMPDTPPDVAVFDGSVRRGKEWEQFKAENAGREIVRRDELAKAEAMRKAVYANAQARKILEVGQGEVTALWEAHGVELRGRIDWLSPVHGIGELKTTRTISRRAFMREVAVRHYHAQLAMYADGYEQAAGVETQREAWIIAVENEPPHDVAVYRVGEESLDEGRRVVDGWVRQVAECTASGNWHGVGGTEAIDLVMPDWALGAGVEDPDLSSLGDLGEEP
jgi:hypothetical protein